MYSNTVDLAQLPLEILEKIISNLRPEEICASIRFISSRFEEVAYNVMRTEYKAIHPLIEVKLEEARNELQKMVVTADTLESEMILVAKFTFLQILYSEYKILCTILFDCDDTEHSPIIFKAVKNLDEFYHLIDGSDREQLNWRVGNISTVIDKLRNLNTELCDEFFWNTWSMETNPFGPLVIKLLGCSIPAKYHVAISHASKPKFRDTKCHLAGQYEIVDLSNSLVSPPGGKKNPYQAAKILAAYICDSVRWGNLFHALRLRWVCMDRALASGRRHNPTWSLIDPQDPYLYTSSQIISEREVELRNSTVKVCRVVEKASEDTSNVPIWLGMRCDFQLWCPIASAPKEMFKTGEHREYLSLAAGVRPSPKPYLFKLEFRVYVRAASAQSQGVIETTIWIEETPNNISFTQSRQLVGF